jgi:sodium-dependent dicarboxylate transporter 2/3/5
MSDTERHRPAAESSNSVGRISALVAGPISAILCLIFVELDSDRPETTRTAAIALWMAIWWISEAVPLAATALLPVVFFPAFGVMNGKVVAAQYVNSTIFLFLGGFLVAIAMQRWNLHRRIALRILLWSGVQPKGMLLGFMASTAILSMWISNTATTMMMTPIVLAVILSLEEHLGVDELGRYPAGLLLGVAYSASIGGIATLVGTPPNLSFARIFSITFPDAPEISFAQWLMFALPLSIVMFVAAWIYLGWMFAPVKAVRLDAQVIRDHYLQLGPMTFQEKIVMADFLLLVILWLFRQDLSLGPVVVPGWSRLLPYPGHLNDGVVAIALAGILFLIPTGRREGGRILSGDAFGRLPWDIVLLFGGGFALAKGFAESGLSGWVGGQLSGLGHIHTLLLIGLLCVTITSLTELTSNTATAEMLLPVLASLAAAIGLNPLLLMIPATLSCSCAFMLPVATPPNAIVFGTKRVRIGQMARTGIFLNLLGVGAIALVTYLLAPMVFDIDVNQLPSWAAGLR